MTIYLLYSIMEWAYTTRVCMYFLLLAEAIRHTLIIGLGYPILSQNRKLAEPNVTTEIGVLLD